MDSTVASATLAGEADEMMVAVAEKIGGNVGGDLSGKGSKGVSSTGINNRGEGTAVGTDEVWTEAVVVTKEVLPKDGDNKVTMRLCSQ